MSLPGRYASCFECREALLLASASNEQDVIRPFFPILSVRRDGQYNRDAITFATNLRAGICLPHLITYRHREADDLSWRLLTHWGWVSHVLDLPRVGGRPLVSSHWMCPASRMTATSEIKVSLTKWWAGFILRRTCGASSVAAANLAELSEKAIFPRRSRNCLRGTEWRMA